MIVALLYARPWAVLPPHEGIGASGSGGRPKHDAATMSVEKRSPRYGRSVSTTRRSRPALVALVIVAALAFLLLGWWQWQRFESAAGTGQNLGYALQWPLFAAFVIYAYRRFVRYEQAPPQHDPDTPIEIPEGLLPERPQAHAPQHDDPALQEYNAYLADLARADENKKRTTT